MAYSDSSPTVSATIAAWKEQAARLGGRDTMLQYRDSRDGSIELTGAHPSGLAQLLAGRATRLSSLVRDPDLLADARRRARSIRQKAEQLSYERGLHAAQMAIGFATWTEDIDGGRREFAAPIMLRHVTLVPRGSRVEDYEIVLSDDITINPALVEFLEGEHGVHIDVDEWVASTGFSHGFDPAPVFERLRAATKSVPGLLVNQRLVVSTFANIATPFTQDTVPADHPVIRALAGDRGAQTQLREGLHGDTGQQPAAEAHSAPGAASGDQHRSTLTVTAADSDRDREDATHDAAHSSESHAHGADSTVHDAGPAAPDAPNSQDTAAAPDVAAVVADDVETHSDLPADGLLIPSGEQLHDDARAAAGREEPTDRADGTHADGRPALNGSHMMVAGPSADDNRPLAKRPDSGSESNPRATSAQGDGPSESAEATAAAEATEPAVGPADAGSATRGDENAADRDDASGRGDEKAAQNDATARDTSNAPLSDAAAEAEGTPSAPTDDTDDTAASASRTSPLTTSRPRRLLPPPTDPTLKKHKEPVPPAATRMTVLNPDPVSLPDRKPQEEFLAIDVDGDQQAVVDAALEGTSLLVHSPPGTGATQTAVALATSLAHTGHSVLYVAQSSDVLDDFAERLTSAGLGDFAIDGRQSAGDLKRRLIGLIGNAEKAKRPELGDLLAELNKQRATLDEHEHSLHRTRQPWGTSVFETMEKLAELTAGDPGPSTAVRLSDDVLQMPSAERASLREALIELSDLGAFTLGVEDTVWLGARFTSDDEAERARSVAERTAKRVPDLVERVEPVLREAELNPPRSIGDWGRALHALNHVQATLEKFKPEVYTRDLGPLIAATGSSEYRREHKADMGLFERNRNKRAARELLRPGAQVADLHDALVAARDERAELAAVSGREGLPTMPEGLSAATHLYDDIAADLDSLEPVLANTPDGGKLQAMLVEEMQARLAALGADHESLADLPRRTRLEERLRAGGFGELIDDLRARRVRHALVADEFELAYWATVLQQMASEDPSVGGHDGQRLHAVAESFAEADSRYVAAGAQRLRFSHAAGWKRAIAEHRDQAEAVRTALRSRHLHLAELSSQAPDVLKALGPVWMMSPFQVPEHFVDAPLFDTVILADAGRLSVPEVIPAISRARQVIALGDDHLLGPRDFSVAVDRRSGRDEPAGESAFTALSAFLPAYRLHTNHRVSPQGLVELVNEQFYSSTLHSLPTALAHEESGLEFAYVPDALGTPDTGTGQVESLDEEVQRVVDLVLRHARTRSRQSLAVVTLTPWHAQRVAAGIQQAIRDYPYVAAFFNDSGREPFVVTDAGQVQGIVRDAVIFSLGYGRTLQGRVVYNFGALSEPTGDRLLATVVTRARRKLTVVSCFEPDDFEPSRLRYGAALLPDLLDAVANGVPDRNRSATAPPDPLVSDIADRLVRRGVSPVEGYGGLELALPVGIDQGMAVAVETDGANYSRLPSIRERERLRPAALQRRGWSYMRLWSTDAFVDPQSEADRIFAAWSETVERRSPQAVLSAARAAAVVVNRQGARPKMTPGLSLRAYSTDDLFAMLDWIQSDGVFRDRSELAEQLAEALALKRRGPESSAVAEVVDKYRSRVQGRRAADGAGDAAHAAADDSQSRGQQRTSSPLASSFDYISQDEAMPSYDTGVLRDEDIIDAGLREPSDDTYGRPESDPSQRDDSGRDDT